MPDIGPVDVEFRIPDDFGKQADAAIRKMAGLTNAATAMPKQVKAAMMDQKAVIKGIEQDISSLEKQMNKVAPGRAKQEIISEAVAAKKALAEEKAALSDLERQMGTSTASNRRLTAQLREMTDQLAKMRGAGLENSEAYALLEGKASKLKESLLQTRQAMKNLADDQRTIKGIAEGVTGLSGAFSAGMGAIGLFAGENQNLAKIQTKVQSLMALTIGLQQVANVLDKESAFMTVTVANAKRSWVAVEKSLAAALWGSNVAAKALMITLTAGLALAIPAIIALVERANKKQKEAQAIQQETVRINKEATKEAGKARTELDLTIAKLSRFNGSKEQEKALVEDINKKYGESFGKYKTLADWLDVLKKKAGDYVQVMLLQAKSQAYVNDALKFQDRSADLKMRPASSFITDMMVEKNMNVITGKVDTKAVNEEAQRRKDQEIAVAEAWYKARIEQAESAQAELLRIEEKSNIGLTTDPEKIKPVNEEKAYTDRITRLKDFYALYKQAAEAGQTEVAAVFQKALPEGLSTYEDFINSEIKKATAAGDTSKLQVLLPEQADVQAKIKELLDKYRTYAEQRADIEKQYNKEIESLTKKGLTANAEVAKNKRDKALKEFDESLPIAQLAAKWRDYDQQIKDIREKGQKDISDLLAAGYKEQAAMRETALKKEISDVEEGKLKISTAWKGLYENVNSLTATELQKLIDTAKANMETMKETLTPTDIEELNEQIAKLQGNVDQLLTKKHKSNNPFEELKASIDTYAASADGSEEKTTALSNAFAEASRIAKELEDTLTGLVGQMVELGIVSEDDASSAVTAITALQKYYTGAASLAVGIVTLNPMQIVSGATQMFDAVVTAFSFKAKKIAKKQAEITKEIAAMERAYAKLQQQIETAIGTEVYDKQREAMKLNEAEIKKYNDLIDQENKKKKKKRDQEAIEGWKNDIAQLEIANEELQQSIIDSLTQTNVKDLATDLMDTIISAAEGGANAFLALGDTIDDVIKAAVANAFKLKYIEPFIAGWIEDFAADLESGGALSPEEADALKERLQKFSAEMAKMWDDFEESFGWTETTGSDSTGGFASMDQSTGNQLLGQFTALRVSAAAIRDILQGESSSRSATRSQIIAIARNTANTVATLEKIDAKLASMENDGVKLR